MDNYKKTIRLLGDYNAMKAHIEKLKRDIENIDYIGVRASNISDEKVQSNKITSMVEDEVLTREKFIKRTNNEIKRLKLIVKNIDEAYKILNDKEKHVIRLKYFETSNTEWFKVAYRVGYSESHCKFIRQQAIKKMSMVIYGK